MARWYNFRLWCHKSYTSSQWSYTCTVQLVQWTTRRSPAAVFGLTIDDSTVYSTLRNRRGARVTYLSSYCTFVCTYTTACIVHTVLYVRFGFGFTVCFKQFFQNTPTVCSVHCTVQYSINSPRYCYICFKQVPITITVIS